jgi:hypothetical protein
MKKTFKKWLSFIIVVSMVALFIPSITVFASMQTIVPGGDWYDNNNNLIEAHDGGIIQVGSTYYLYGNDRTYYGTGGTFDIAFYKLNMYS